MMKRIRITLLMFTSLCSLFGCASFCDEMISMEMGCRNHILAQKAWGHWSWCYDDLEHPWHFAKGFKQGYRDVLDGGTGCQPTLPPQCYWKPYFQTPEGQCQIHSWFDGYSHGALAAKQDGYSQLGQIPISPTARANVEAARSRPMPQLFGGGEYLEHSIYDHPGSESPEVNSPQPVPAEGGLLNVPLQPGPDSGKKVPYE